MDELHELHITINSRYTKDIEALGYLEQKKKDNLHKLKVGEYISDKNNNIIIIHACPDREIFKLDIKSFLDDLSIDQSWVEEAIFTVI